MRFSKDIVLITAIAIFATFLQGCIIPILGFGYTGYQYHEKEGVFAPGQPLGGAAPDDKSASNGKSSNSTSKPPPPTDNSIE